jgi:glutathione S-transferase
VDASLKEKTWLMGQRFTVADAYLFTVLRWAYALKLDLTGLSNIEGFMKRMSERESVKAALAAEQASA